MVLRSHRSRVVMGGALSALVVAGFAVDARAAYDWPQFNGSALHDGNDVNETTLAPSNVSQLALKFQVKLPALADSTPVVLANVATSSGTHDIVYVTTEPGHILALDAHTGSTIWSHQVGPGSCLINNGSKACYTTSSPAVDPSRTYVYAYGLDGYVHRYAVGTGVEATTGGWPELTTAKAYDEKGSSALTIAQATSGTYLYVTHGGYPGDGGNYQGHLTAINLATGAQNVFNTVCSDQTVHFIEPGSPDCAAVQSAVWARAGVVYVAALDKIFFASGNGAYSPASHYWGDTLMSAHADATGASGAPLDTYTPTNFATLQSQDLDLGSSAPAVFPANANAKVPHLALLGGKDAILRLVNLDNLSGQGGPGHTGGEVTTISVPGNREVLTAPAIWANPADGTHWAFVTTSNVACGIKLTADSSGNPTLTVVWQSSNGGNSPIVANNVVYYASSGAVRALDPTTGSVLWQNTTIGNLHWQSPVVANGTLYILDDSAFLSAFTVPPVKSPAMPRSLTWVMAAALLLAGLGVVQLRRELSL